MKVLSIRLKDYLRSLETRSFYVILNCRVRNRNRSFEVMIGFRQGCVVLILLFNLSVDWVTRENTADKEDSEFVEDLALLSNTHRHNIKKTATTTTNTHRFKINQNKSKVMTLCETPCTNKNWPERPFNYKRIFRYLGCIDTNDLGANIYLELPKQDHAFKINVQQFMNDTNM